MCLSNATCSATLRSAAVQPHHVVAVQVAFERHILKQPVFHLTGARVETRPLSAMGQGESTRIAPPRLEKARYGDDDVRPLVQGVAATSCICEKVNFDTGFCKHLAGSRVENRNQAVSSCGVKCNVGLCRLNQVDP
jgi:hypothetical protein